MPEDRAPIGWIREIVLNTPDPTRWRPSGRELVGGTPTEWYDGWVTLEPPPHGQRLSFQRSPRSAPARRRARRRAGRGPRGRARGGLAAGGAYVEERRSPRRARREHGPVARVRRPGGPPCSAWWSAEPGRQTANQSPAYQYSPSSRSRERSDGRRGLPPGGLASARHARRERGDSLRVDRVAVRRGDVHDASPYRARPGRRRTAKPELPGRRGYWRRVTWTSTNIREVPVPEKMPESGLTSL